MFYKNFFDLSLDLFCIANAEGYFTELNQRWEDITGYSIEELKAHPYMHFVHPDDRGDTQNATVKLSQGEPIYTFKNRYIHKNGKVIWLSWNSVNRDNKIYAVARDITAERNNEILLEQLQTNAKIGGWRRDLSASLIERTSQIYSIYDFDDLGQHTYEGVLALLQPDAREKLISMANACRLNGESFDDIFPLVSAKGRKKWVRIVGHADYERGKMVSVSGTVQDVTDQMIAKINLDQERIKSMQTSKLSMLGQLSAGVAHEINNPLSIISAANHSIMKHLDNPDKVKANSEIITKSVKRAANIVSGLKKFSRTGEKHQRAHVPLAVFFEELSLLLDPSLKTDYVSIEYNVDSSETTAYCSEMDLTQILINLIQNAAYAASETDEKWVKVIAKHKGDYTQISIIDSGKGLSQENLDNLYVPFYTTKPVGQGTGLGLSIAKGLVESNEGQIDYELADGHTCFTLKFKNN